jgi:hypothetical protein
MNTYDAVEDSVSLVEFSDTSVYDNTRPVSCSINNYVINAGSWAAMLVKVCELLLTVKNSRLLSIHLKTKSGESVPLLMDKPLTGLRCEKLSNGKFLNVNYFAPNAVRLIGMLCDACGVRKETIGLSYTTATVIKPLVIKPTIQGTLLDNIPEKLQVAIDIIIAEKFSNGFAYGSPIQIGRLKHFVSEMIRGEIDCSDEELIAYIKQCGTEFDGKIHIVSPNVKEKIRNVIDDYFGTGAGVIFYEAFFSKHESKLMESSIVSEKMLTSLLYKLYPKLQFTLTYFGHYNEAINNVITSEILRIWGNDGVLSYSQISERLPYIPLWRVKQTVSSNNDFIINRRETVTGDGECIHISKIAIADEDKKEIQEKVAKGCHINRYISLANIDVAEVIERNCNLSETALYAAIFQICLDSNRYERHGKIITRKGDGIDTFYIMKEFCLSQDRIKLAELLAFEEESAGECHCRIPMQAGYDTMIRVSEDLFISDKHLEFDIDTIDSAIEHYVAGGEYVPLQSVTTFAMFPHCGQSWNLFLLESYARRFSYSFRFDVRSVNSKNIGAIVRKNSKLTYDDIMADFAAKADITLTRQNVLNCLLDGGLIAQRKHKDIDNLIKKAKMIRERRN